jgi:Tryptophan dimethylallyltransferase
MTLEIERNTFTFSYPQLEGLCNASGLAHQQTQVLGLFHSLAGLCNARDPKLPPRWSGVTDDCTPLEFSIAIHDGLARIRILVEAQDDPASPFTYWKAGKKLNEWLALRYGVDFTRYDQIEDLFVPADPLAYVAIWHAVDFRHEGSPLFKVYLNPAAQGATRASDITSQAIGRLGFQRAWPAIKKMCQARDTFVHFSLDLSSERTARTKIYIRHRNATLAELVDRASAVYGNIGDDWSRFCRAICGDLSTLWLRPVLSCYHLTAADPERPSDATLYVPLFPYARNDFVAYERITAFLKECALPVDIYSRCVHALTSSDLSSQQGIHTFISYQGTKENCQVTTYFNPRAFYSKYGWLALEPDRCWPSPITR